MDPDEHSSANGDITEPTSLIRVSKDDLEVIKTARRSLASGCPVQDHRDLTNGLLIPGSRVRAPGGPLDLGCPLFGGHAFPGGNRRHFLWDRAPHPSRGHAPGPPSRRLGSHADTLGPPRKRRLPARTANFMIFLRCLPGRCGSSHSRTRQPRPPRVRCYFPAPAVGVPGSIGDVLGCQRVGEGHHVGDEVGECVGIGVPVDSLSFPPSPEGACASGRQADDRLRQQSQLDPAIVGRAAQGTVHRRAVQLVPAGQPPNVGPVALARVGITERQRGGQLSASTVSSGYPRIWNPPSASNCGYCVTTTPGVTGRAW